MKRKNRKIIADKYASFPVLETLISIGICITLLSVVLTSLNNTYTIEIRPEVDLKERSSAILEQLISTPGQIYKDNPYWEGAIDDINSLGLGTSRTVAYGILYDEGGTIHLLGDQYSLSNDNIGIIEHCFLKGTKVLMADNSWKKIEELTIGEIVKSYDLENEKFKSARISNFFYYPKDEMGSDYYLMINNELKVTPDHEFFSEGKWVFAKDLDVGDFLYSPSSGCYIYSIDKIYEKRPVYNLEIENYHNFFVKIEDFSVLVHNELLFADFSWFDKDGLENGQDIHFDASPSLGDAIESHEWDMNNDGFFGVDPDPVGDNIEVDFDLEDNDQHIISLKIKKGENEHICTKIVQANNYEPPDLDEWIENDFTAYPEIGDNTFSSYDERYYVKYSQLDVSHDTNYYLYEVKEKNNNCYSILDLEKLQKLKDFDIDDYQAFKTDFGLETSIETSNLLYNFNITIRRNEGVPVVFGASYANTNNMQSNSRDVLIYRPPETSGYDIVSSPRYEKAEIVVRVFIGGYYK